MKIKNLKLIILGAIIIVVGIGVYFMMQLEPQGRVSTELSERSKEFIASQANEDGSEWSGVNLEGGGSADTRNTTFNVDNCFSFKMLYRVFNQRIQDKCSGYYAFNNPKGSIVAYLREASNIGSVDMAEGVSFRRLSPEKYKERTKTLAGKDFLIFNNIEEPYESIAYHYFPGHYLAFVLEAATTENLDKDFEEMLGSIQITKKN